MKRLTFLTIGCFTALIFLNASGCKNKSETPANTQPAVVEEKPVITENPSTPAASAPDVSKIMPDLAKVKITTKYGDMIVALYNETPLHRDNFLKLASEKYYDGLLFHRCIKNFMIQGGDPQSRGASPSAMLGNGGPGYTVPAEFRPHLIHKKGALCAARQGDQVNPKKESSGSQFYIVQGQPWTDMQLSQIEMNIGSSMPGFKYTDEQKQLYKTVGGTAQLDMNYTVYGEVIYGLNVVDSIAMLQGNQMNRPLKDVSMSMEVIQKDHK
ncbi:MAG: peptidylprolyl isomerase [Flavobacteriales bacterium]|nr:peptidylprolyl isomerase [Flavobacteriales bacterium]